MAKVEEPAVDIEAMIKDLDQKISRLRVLYEQHFLGIEKRPPLIPLKQVVRLIREIESQNLRKTSIKFRMRSLVQKFQSYRSYWNRTTREIENGTYKRHKQKLEKKIQDEIVTDALKTVPTEAPPQRNQGPINIDVGEVEEMSAADMVAMGMDPAYAATYNAPNQHRIAPKPASAVRGMPQEAVQKRADKLAEIRAKLGLGGPSPAPSGPPAATPRPPAPPTSQPRRSRRPVRRPTADTYRSGVFADEGVRSSLGRAGLNETRLQDIYKTLVDAKQKCNQSTAKLTYDNVVRSIAKQAKSVQQKHSSAGVDFNVVIRDGRAYLKPEPK